MILYQNILPHTSVAHDKTKHWVNLKQNMGKTVALKLYVKNKLHFFYAKVKVRA
jgi:hypothetical protein